MRERFVIDPDRTKPRSEPYAAARKVALILALALTGVAGIHSLYPQGNAAADARRSGDRPTPAPNTLAPTLAATNPMPVASPTNSAQALRVEAQQPAAGSILAESRAAAQLQAPENQGRISPEQPPAKVAEASPPPKQKAVRHRSTREAAAYAPYGYRENRSWAWYSQRPAAPFFHF
jgi:hypothetical protein